MKLVMETMEDVGNASKRLKEWPTECRCKALAGQIQDNLLLIAQALVTLSSIHNNHVIKVENTRLHAADPTAPIEEPPVSMEEIALRTDLRVITGSAALFEGCVEALAEDNGMACSKQLREAIEAVIPCTWDQWLKTFGEMYKQDKAKQGAPA